MLQKVKQFRLRKWRSEEDVKNKDGKWFLLKKISLERRVEYNRELNSDERPNICADTDNIHSTVNNSEVEVKETISKLPKRKSTE